MSFRARALPFSALLLVLAFGCRTTSTAVEPASDDVDAAAGVDALQMPSMTCTPGAGHRPGAACGCKAECASGFCVDGVCCDKACDGACQTCTLPGKAGTCAPAAAGATPRMADACPKEATSTCGHDGTCDG